MTLLWQSFTLLLAIPLFTMALEPSNPASLCDRFVGDDEVQACEKKTHDSKVDWYAATVCNLQSDQASFWNCWSEIENARFSPAALDKCAENQSLDDVSRLACVKAAKAGRQPASVNNTEFQSLQIKKK
ncbi:hypothetical protein D3C87_124430 [compost metagenome]